MFNIFFKELGEVLRDRRTLVFMLLVPAFIVPAVMFLFGALSGYQQQAENNRVLKYAVFANADAPILRSILSRKSTLQPVQYKNLAEAVEAVREKQLDFVIEADFPTKQEVDMSNPATMKLRYNTAVPVDSVEKRVKPLLKDDYTEATRMAYLSRHGITGANASTANIPVKLSVESTASERERYGELIGAFVPYILLMLGLSASTSVAIDLGAGEKERGTLESLLLLPISRAKIVLSKFVLIMLIGSVCGTIAVVSLAVLSMLTLEAANMSVIHSVLNYIKLSDLAMFGLLMVPAYGILSATMVALSFFAKSHKEAAGYMNQLTVFTIIPVMISFLPGVSLKGAWSLIPITNVCLAMKEIIKGTLPVQGCIVAIGSTSIVAAALLAFCVFWCKQEEVLFRT